MLITPYAQSNFRRKHSPQWVQRDRWPFARGQLIGDYNRAAIRCYFGVIYKECMDQGPGVGLAQPTGHS